MKRLRWYESYTLEQGALDTLTPIEVRGDSAGYGASDWSEAHEVELVACPECKETLPFTSVEEAKEFLKTGTLPKQK